MHQPAQEPDHDLTAQEVLHYNVGMRVGGPASSSSHNNHRRPGEPGVVWLQTAVHSDPRIGRNLSSEKLGERQERPRNPTILR